MKHLSTARKRYSVSSGERKRIRPNRVRVQAGRRCVHGVVGPFREICRSPKESKIRVIVEGIERPGIEGVTPVDEIARTPESHPK